MRIFLTGFEEFDGVKISSAEDGYKLQVGKETKTENMENVKLEYKINAMFLEEEGYEEKGSRGKKLKTG